MCLEEEEKSLSSAACVFVCVPEIVFCSFFFSWINAVGYWEIMCWCVCGVGALIGDGDWYNLALHDVHRRKLNWFGLLA